MNCMRTHFLRATIRASKRVQKVLLPIGPITIIKSPARLMSTLQLNNNNNNKWQEFCHDFKRSDQQANLVIAYSKSLNLETIERAILKSKVFAQSFAEDVLKTQDLTYIKQFTKDYIIKCMYNSVTDETRSQLEDFIIANNKSVPKVVLTAFLLADKEKNKLYIDKLLNYSITNKDYQLLSVFWGFYGDILFKYCPIETLTNFINFIFSDITKIPYNIIYGGVGESIPFTEKYIDYIVDNNKYLEMEKLMGWNILRLFDNSSTKTDKFITYIINNLELISPNVITHGITFNQILKRKFIDATIAKNKFIPGLGWDTMESIYDANYRTKELEQVILNNMHTIPDHYLVEICLSWSIKFSNNCIDKLTELKKHDLANKCRIWLEQNKCFF